MNRVHVDFQRFQRLFRKLGTPEKKRILSSFFKTGKGQYGEGDLFLGINVPQIRARLQLSSQLTQGNILKLVRSPYHEERLLGLLTWVAQFKKGSQLDQTQIYRLYMMERKYVNNWDLVDLSAPYILGPFLFERGEAAALRVWKPLLSGNLWDRRIAVLSTFHWIRQEQFGPTLGMAKTLLKDSEDLMHKAVGWMLREVGKRNLSALCQFLDAHASVMPRIMLRYSLEKMTPSRRKYYMNLKAQRKDVSG